MSYFPLTLDGDGATYHMVGEVATPDDAATLSTFQWIQRAANALLFKKSQPLIDVDGRIGPNTMAALLTLSSDPGSISSTQTIAENAYGLLQALNAQMATDGAIYVPDPPPTSPPSVAAGSGVQNPDPETIKKFGGQSTSMMTLVVIAISAGAVASVLFKPKKRSRRR